MSAEDRRVQYWQTVHTVRQHGLDGAESQRIG